MPTVSTKEQKACLNEVQIHRKMWQVQPATFFVDFVILFGTFWSPLGTNGAPLWRPLATTNVTNQTRPLVGDVDCSNEPLTFDPIDIVLEPSGVILEPPGVILEPPGVNLEPPSVTLEPPGERTELFVAPELDLGEDFDLFEESAPISVSSSDIELLAESEFPDEVDDLVTDF